MADKNTEFHEGTTAPVGETSSYGWTPGSGSDPFNGEAFGWSGSDEPDADDSKATYGG